jgi:hypothetical protein
MFAALWLLIAFTDSASTPILVRVGAGGSMAFSYLVTWYLPIWFKNRHIRSQNRLLDRCRALLILGSRAHADGDKVRADDALDRIRRLESHWRFGNAMSFRVALAVWAIGWGVLACVGIRFVGLMMTHYGWTGRLIASDGVPLELWLAVVISIFAILHALASYFETWVNPWIIENCGDRLSQLRRRHLALPLGHMRASQQSSLSRPRISGRGVLSGHDDLADGPEGDTGEL